jgi:transposase InsO family protein
VDAYSKWVDCYDMTVSHSSRAVITKLYDWISRVGIPHTLVSDNGTSFTSQEFKDFCALNGIKHILSPVYHAASNGQCEIFVKIVKKGLKTILLNNTNKNIIPDVPSNHKTVQIKS